MEQLFALLRLGLDTSTKEKENLSDFIMLTEVQWVQLGDMARNQGVLGILLDGIDKIENTRYGFTRELNVNQKLEWIGEVIQIEESNRQQILVMNDLAEKWHQDGIRIMVMKGQANGLLYPKPHHRSPGDIDCYLFENYARGNEIARNAGADVDEGWYKHSQISYKDELFENHQFFVHTRDGVRGKRLEKELEDALNVDSSDFGTLTSNILIPPCQWTAMFLTYHACAHFISEGLRLKQILDWAMFLDKHQQDVDWNRFYEYCDRNHLRKFADAMTAICVEHLGLVINNTNIVVESPYTEKILHDTLYADDYVYNAGGSVWKCRWLVVKNLFKYRWKYEEIYEESVWKQLWWYLSGYLFHTEKLIIDYDSNTKSYD